MAVIATKFWDNGQPGWGTSEDNNNADAGISGSGFKSRQYNSDTTEFGTNFLDVDPVLKWVNPLTLDVYDTMKVEFFRGNWYQGTTPTARAEFYTERQNAQTFAVGFMYRYDPNYVPDNPCKQIFWQRHVTTSAGSWTNTGNPGISMRIFNNKFTLVIERSSGVVEFDCGAVIQGAWHKVVLLAKSSLTSDGFVHVFIDDTLRHSYSGITLTGTGTMDWNIATVGSKFGFYMSNLYTGSCITPESFTRWTQNFSRIMNCSGSFGEFAEMYRLASPTRTDANVITYPDGTLPIPTPNPTELRLRLKFQESVL